MQVSLCFMRVKILHLTTFSDEFDKGITLTLMQTMRERMLGLRVCVDLGVCVHVCVCVYVCVCVCMWLLVCVCVFRLLLRVYGAVCVIILGLCVHHLSCLHYRSISDPCCLV